MILLIGQHIRQSSLYLVIQILEGLGVLQTVEAVVRTQRHRLGADKFPMFSVGWTGHGFCRELDPAGLSSGLPP